MALTLYADDQCYGACTPYHRGCMCITRENGWENFHIWGTTIFLFLTISFFFEGGGTVVL